MKVYIAGPMQGIPEFNFPKFNEAAGYVRAQGHEVFNPAENDKDSQGIEPDKAVPDGDIKKLEAKGFSRRRALAEDLHWIGTHADAILMLSGWENSGGARVEHALAVTIGLKVWYWSEWEGCFS